MLINKEEGISTTIFRSQGEKGRMAKIYFAYYCTQYSYIVKHLFHIENGANDNGQQVLSLRLGGKHASFAITNKPGTELCRLAYCSTEELDENELSEFVETYPCLLNNFYEILVSYDFPQSIFVPFNEYKLEDAGLLLQASGATSGNQNIISELVTGWQLYNVYAVPREILEWIGKKFPTAKCRHQYSLHIKNVNTVNTDSNLTVDFRKEFFTVVVTRNSKLLLAQTFEYTSPEDVLYFLLNICKQFSLSQREVKLQISGLVDKQSSLYKELYLYFINLEFREANWEAKSEYPAHFFTSLNDLAKCAS